ncbi:MAG: hypothetical protein LQ351_005890 [Letrouitia transgressa]|nr:MAG: hypothetical protein LQ351_005890 [Letrouitia transgressa]
MSKARLTFNYWRKGGYSIGSEDYRWNVLKEYINAPLFFLFNVIFISFAQSLLLFSITTPTYILLLAASQSKPNSIDVLVTQILLGSVYLAFTADQQQWELITARKYPEYKEYQRRVGKFLPNFLTGLPGDFSDKKGTVGKAQ